MHVSWNLTMVGKYAISTVYIHSSSGKKRNSYRWSRYTGCPSICSPCIASLLELRTSLSLARAKLENRFPISYTAPQSSPLAANRDITLILSWFNAHERSFASSKPKRHEISSRDVVPVRHSESCSSRNRPSSNDLDVSVATDSFPPILRSGRLDGGLLPFVGFQFVTGMETWLSASTK